MMKAEVNEELQKRNYQMQIKSKKISSMKGGKKKKGNIASVKNTLTALSDSESVCRISSIVFSTVPLHSK